MMRRVRRNCARFVSRLRSLGYVFGTFNDETCFAFAVPPLTLPSKAMHADCAELEAQAGPLPLSLMAFWQEVAAVDLIGMHPKWPNGLDPLVVDPHEGAMSFLFDDEEDESPGKFAGLAPHDLHKDNVSGGDRYGVRLPNP